MGLRASFHTLGCKVNAYETEAMQELLAAAGYEIVPFEEPADVCVINTCSVTQMAEHKSRQMIHRARKLNPDAVVIAAGCYAQRAPDDLDIDGTADIVVGNNNKSRILEIAKDLVKEKGQAQAVEDLTHCRDYESQSISSLGENVRAYVKIQDGCDRFCSYCIIPYVRGRSRCRSEEEILKEVNALAGNGYKEVVLTGIDISTYEGLAALIGKVSDIEGIRRIRLGSLEAGVITEEFIREAAKYDKLCPQFHLSLQSGCAATLKRMNRHYSPEEFLKRVRLLKGNFESCAITTDVIVGFPGETEADFAETCSLVEEIGFDSAFTFIYSKRSGTPAARMQDQVPDDVKHARLQKLMDVQNLQSLCINRRLVGETVEVMAEGPTEKHPEIWSGRTRGNKLVLWQQNTVVKEADGRETEIKTSEGSDFSVRPGQMVQVKVKNAQTWLVKGTRVK